MRRAVVGTLLIGLVIVLAVLTPLAYASPPDPTWISGFFDDGDNDDAVFFITSSTATLEALPLGGWSFFGVFLPAAVCADRGPAPSLAFSAVAVRAPPIS